MTTYVSCRKCAPRTTPLFFGNPEDPDECLFELPGTPPGTWIYRGASTYYCTHKTTAAKVVSRPWYSDVASTMNARQGRENIT